jgi:hypothetical protein
MDWRSGQEIAILLVSAERSRVGINNISEDMYMKFVSTAQGKEVTTTHKTLGELKLGVEVPQVESVDEFVSFCGGNEQALTFINKSIADDDKAGVRAALKSIPDGSDVEAAYERIRGISKNYTPQAADGREVRAKKVAAFDTIQNSVNEKLAKGEEISVEDLLAMLAAAK